MRKLIFVCILMNVSLLAYSQAIHIFHDGKELPDVIANAGVDSIYFAPKFAGSTEYQQVFVTKDGEKRYDIVDSVKFNLPHLVATRHTYTIPNEDSDIRVDFAVSRFVRGTFPQLPDIKSPYNHASWQYRTGLFYKDFPRFMDGFWMTCMLNGVGYRFYDHGDEADVHSEIWYIKNVDFDNMQDSIVINYTDVPFANDRYEYMCFSAEESEWKYDFNYPITKILLSGGDDGVWYYKEKDQPAEKDLAPASPVYTWYNNEDGKPVIHLLKNESGAKRRIWVQLCTEDFRVRGWLDQLPSFKHTAEEHMNALRDFCNSTDYENWGKGLNWWSDEPLWKWDAINYNPGYTGGEYYWYIDDHIVHLGYLPTKTGIHGKLPSSFEVFMDDVDDIFDVRNCALYGEIPYNIRHHDRWSEWGWLFIVQDVWNGGGFDMEDINLRMKDEEIMYADGTKSTAYEELAKHKLTFVSIGGPSEPFCNLCLSYANKGFEYIYAAQNWLGGTQEEAQMASKEYENIPNVKVCYQSWVNGNLSAGLQNMGSTFLLDSEGNVIDFAPMDWSLDESFYVNRLESLLLKYLGEPEEHEPYIPKPIYESSDYSNDGKVLTLQEATVGKGIDLVFLGDMYVDTLLVEGGQYEQDMRAAMEYFFEIEPYKTLRNRFNVYTVKVVSPNGYEGSEHKFNFDGDLVSDLVFEYTQKVPNVDMDHVAVTVINNNKNVFYASGEAGMWESGASIAWIKEGGPSDIICHETGGHGVAKLIDEYIFGGYEGNHTQEGYNESFREWIKTAYHDKGWGMNISASDDPEEVPWSHFLKDERYQDEVGIYKGAWMWPEELWRPSENSVMNNSSYLWFNAPSREAIYKTVMKLSEGEDWTYDYETFVEFDTPIREAHKQAMAKARKMGGDGQDVQKRRIELRPPTIYKGSWRDAGKCEKVTFDADKFVHPTASKLKARKSAGNDARMKDATQQHSQKPYIMYKGNKYDVDEYKNMKESHSLE